MCWYNIVAGNMPIYLHLCAITVGRHYYYQKNKKYVKTYRVYLIGLCNETYNSSKRFEYK